MSDFAIAVDFGTIANVTKAFIEYLNQMRGKHINYDFLQTPEPWNLTDEWRTRYKEYEDEFFRLYFGGMTHPVPGAREAIDVLRRRYENISVFVSCDTQHVDLVRAWIMIHFNWRPTIIFVPKRAKELAPIGALTAAMAIDAYVGDDAVKAQEVAFYDGAVTLLQRTWNERYEPQLVTRAMSWEEIPEQMQEFDQVRAH